MTEHGREAALDWGPSPIDSSALLSTCSAPLRSSEKSLVLQRQPGNHHQGWERKMHSELEGSWLIQREVPAPGPWLVHSHATGDSKSSVWLLQKALSWLVGMEPLWLVGEDADGDIAVPGPMGWGKCRSYSLKLLYKGSSSAVRNKVQAGKSMQASPWRAVYVRDPCVEMAAGFGF